MDIAWILLADQVLLIVLVGVATTFAWRSSRNTRWLQEVLTPVLTHVVSLIDPDYPKPPDPPPIKG